MCGPQIRASARLLPGPSSAITLDFLVCDLSVPATLLGYGARGYCPTMFGEIARRRLAVRGGRLRPAKHAAELDTDRILRQLPPVDQLIRKFGDLALGGIRRGRAEMHGMRTPRCQRADGKAK
jgi:hypothetical protein